MDVADVNGCGGRDSACLVAGYAGAGVGDAGRQARQARQFFPMSFMATSAPPLPARTRV
jgi:hypothetical protein